MGPHAGKSSKTLVLVAVSILQTLACASAAEVSGHIPWATGRQLSQTLAQPIDVFWSNNPLRRAMTSLSRAQQVAILIDRRVDPGQRLTLNLQNVPLETILQTRGETLRFGPRAARTGRLPRSAGGRRTPASAGHGHGPGGTATARSGAAQVLADSALGVGRPGHAARPARATGAAERHRNRRPGTRAARPVGGRRSAAATVGRAADADRRPVRPGLHDCRRRHAARTGAHAQGPPGAARGSPPAFGRPCGLNIVRHTNRPPAWNGSAFSGCRCGTNRWAPCSASLPERLGLQLKLDEQAIQRAGISLGPAGLGAGGKRHRRSVAARSCSSPPA